MTKLPTYFISHGGGPWPYMEDRRRALHILEKSLVDIPRQIGVVPKAVLMILIVHPLLYLIVKEFRRRSQEKL